MTIVVMLLALLHSRTVVNAYDDDDDGDDSRCD